jgi:hypothetical protein
VVSEVEVAYTEPAGAGFDTVTILPDGPTVEVSEAF